MQNRRQNNRQRFPPTVLEKTGGSFTDQIFSILRERIVTGQIRPNERLIESEIAEGFGSSRTPVREAFRLLQSTGYVSTLLSGRQVAVTDYSSGKLERLFQIREALETMAIKMACQWISEEQIKKTEEYYRRSVEAFNSHDIEQSIELDYIFHDTIYAACGNEELLSLVRTHRYQYAARWVVSMFISRDWASQIKQHGQILEAVRERNALKAERRTRKHLRTSLRIAWPQRL